MEEVVFYKEWLNLSKREFRILMYLAIHGSQRANLSDMCRWFEVDPQTSNRNKIKAAIEELANSRMIQYSLKGRTYTLSLIPKETEITLPVEWVLQIMRRERYSDSVAVEVVVKVLLWLKDYGANRFQNFQITSELRIGTTTLNCAKKVLRDDFGAIMQNIIRTKISEGVFITEGQEIYLSAWLKEE